MHTSEAINLEKEHARWQAEHGHWLKDLTIWHRRHKDAQVILDELERSLKSFSEQVEAQRSHIEQHQEVLRMHEDAMLWRQQHGGTKKNIGFSPAIDPVHRVQEDIHEQERSIHQQLAKMHETIRMDATRLAEALGLIV